MTKFIIAATVAVVLGFGGAAVWHAKAAAPAASVPVVAPYTHIHPAACNGTTGGHGCGAGFTWACNPSGCACVRC